MGICVLNCAVIQSLMAVLALAAPALESAVISADVPPNPACCRKRDASAGVGGLIVIAGGAARWRERLRTHHQLKCPLQLPAWNRR